MDHDAAAAVRSYKSVYESRSMLKQCCSGVKIYLAASKYISKCCKSRLNSKALQIAQAHKQTKKELSITSMIKQMRTLEAIIKEKLLLSDKEWFEARQKFSLRAPPPPKPSVGP